jgi:hypothetical protein
LRKKINGCCPAIVAGSIVESVYLNTFTQECNQPACREHDNDDYRVDDMHGTVDRVFWNEYGAVIGKPPLQRAIEHQQ